MHGILGKQSKRENLKSARDIIETKNKENPNKAPSTRAIFIWQFLGGSF